MEKRNKNQSGFLTLEIVFALSFFSLLVVGTVALVFSNQFMAVDAENNAQALELAKNEMENSLVRGFSFTSAADVVDGGFTEHTQADWLSDYAKEISSKASYVSSGRPQVTELDSVVTDVQSGLGRDTCALGFLGDWSHPVLRGSYTTAAGNPATDIDAQNNKVYVATNGATQSLPDFFVIDGSDASHPALLKSINTGPV